MYIRKYLSAPNKVIDHWLEDTRLGDMEEEEDIVPSSITSHSHHSKVMGGVICYVSGMGKYSY
jgi:hypothetical protein